MRALFDGFVQRQVTVGAQGHLAFVAFERRHQVVAHVAHHHLRGLGGGSSGGGGDDGCDDHSGGFCNRRWSGSDGFRSSSSGRDNNSRRLRHSGDRSSGHSRLGRCNRRNSRRRLGDNSSRNSGRSSGRRGRRGQRPCDGERSSSGDRRTRRNRSSGKQCSSCGYCLCRRSLADRRSDVTRELRWRVHLLVAART